MEYSDEYAFVWKLRKYLLLLATLVVSATYVAGLYPPGGLFVEADKEGHRVGDPVLATTNPTRYAIFFYCNAAAFLASLVIVMVLLDQRIVGNRVGLTVLRSAMVLYLLALTGAFAAGSCQDVHASIYVPAAFAVLLAYVAIHLLVAASTLFKKNGDAGHSDAEESRLNGRWKLPLLLATFVTPLAYGAGLAPPGGFWVTGDPVLAYSSSERYAAFFYCNATCFVSSLVISTLLMSRRMLSGRVARSYALQVCVLVELLGLMGAYAAGSCRSVQPTVYSISLAAAALLYIALVGLFSMDAIKKWLGRRRDLEQESRHEEQHDVPSDTNESDAQILVESRSLLLLLATLTVTVTYQAGLNPPGGYWRYGNRGDYKSGHPWLLDVMPKRFNAFFQCNTTALVASLVVIVIVQSKQMLISRATIRRHVLQAAIITSMFGLMGAYAAGSSRDINTTIYISALAVGNVVAFITLGRSSTDSKLILWVEGTVYKVLKKLHLLDGDGDGDGQGQSEGDEEDSLKKKRKSLLQLAILAATVTYQTGLYSSGGYEYASSDTERLPSDTILLGYDPGRYLVFFYCNAAEFMASVAVILLLVNRRLHKQSIRSNALQACIMVGFLALRTAYAIGSTQKVSTSIYVFGLVAAVITYLALQILPLMLKSCTGPPTVPRLPPWLHQLFEPLPLRPNVQKKKVSGSEDKSGQQQQQQRRRRRQRYSGKYLMLLGILTASMTYQAGLVPPGSTWEDNTAGYIPGDPIMSNLHPLRYRTFFHCNTTSFAGSVVLVVLLLQRTVSPRGAPLGAMHAAMALDLAGLLGAYAAGSCWMWEQALAYATAIVAALVVYVTLHAMLWHGNITDPAAPTASPASSNQQGGNVTTEV